MSYRLLSYVLKGQPRAGLLVNEAVYDLAAATRNAAWSSVLAVLNDWPKAKAALAKAAKATRAKGLPLAKTKLLAPILYPGNIYCAGANYKDHVAEMDRAQGREPGPTMKDRGEKPWHFVKTSKSSVVGPGAKVKLPAFSKAVDWEVELAAVIGKRAKDVSVDKALDCVAGYTIANDLSARDVMRREGNPPTSPFHYDWVSQKCFDGACPLGPWIVMFAERMTALQRSLSCRSTSAISRGVLPTGSACISVSRRLKSGSCTARAIPADSLFAMSAGVPGGATYAIHVSEWKPGRRSAIAGTSGNAATRFSPPTPSSLSLLAFTCGIAVIRLSNISST